MFSLTFLPRLLNLTSSNLTILFAPRTSKGYIKFSFSQHGKSTQWKLKNFKLNEADTKCNIIHMMKLNPTLISWHSAIIHCEKCIYSYIGNLTRKKRWILIIPKLYHRSIKILQFNWLILGYWQDVFLFDHSIAFNTGVQYISDSTTARETNPQHWFTLRSLLKSIVYKYAMFWLDVKK